MGPAHVLVSPGRRVTAPSARVGRRSGSLIVIVGAVAVVGAAIGPNVGAHPTAARLAIAAAVTFLAVLAALLRRREGQLADALLLAERRILAIGDSAHEWLWTSDPAGMITDSNRAVQDLLGFRAE